MTRNQIVQVSQLKTGDIFYQLSDKDKASLQVLEVDSKHIIALAPRFLDAQFNYLWKKKISVNKEVVYLRNVKEVEV